MVAQLFLSRSLATTQPRAKNRLWILITASLLLKSCFLIVFSYNPGWNGCKREIVNRPPGTPRAVGPRILLKMPITASSQPPVPLTTLPQQQAGNNNTSAPPTAPNNSVSTPNPAAQTQIQPAAVQQPSSRSRTWRDRLGDTFSTANGIGTFALIAALVFGIGAWVGMKIQISQGAQNMDLAIWTACADHQVCL